jgi:hypothetical protein
MASTPGNAYWRCWTRSPQTPASGPALTDLGASTGVLSLVRPAKGFANTSRAPGGRDRTHGPSAEHESIRGPTTSDREYARLATSYRTELRSETSGAKTQGSPGACLQMWATRKRPCSRARISQGSARSISPTPPSTSIGTTAPTTSSWRSWLTLSSVELTEVRDRYHVTYHPSVRSERSVRTRYSWVWSALPT